MSVIATSINCIDGRIQKPIAEYIKENHQVDYVDTVTFPGANKLLDDNRDKDLIEIIKKSVSVSIKTNGSKLIAVSGHFDCRGNPSEKTLQNEQTKGAAELIRSWGLGVEVIALWVDHNWQVNAL